MLLECPAYCSERDEYMSLASAEIGTEVNLTLSVPLGFHESISSSVLREVTAHTANFVLAIGRQVYPATPGLLPANELGNPKVT